MKKLISTLLAAALCLSMSTVAFAEEPETYQDMDTVTITKDYNATNTGTTSPAETFNFTIERTRVTDAAAGVTAENMPIPTIGSVAYGAGDAGSANKSKDITVNLPKYTSVGIYTYTIKETAGTTAGVTYYGKDITLKVTVIQDTEGKVRVAAVHTEGENEAKSDQFSNEYSAGSLTVAKKVTGNMGDQSKDFTVTVEFTAPEGTTVKEAISYTDGTEHKTVAVSDWKNGKATAEITLRHDESVNFTNIPYGVTYTVTESDYTSDGYDAAAYEFGDDNKKIDSAEDKVTITNNKGTTVDTGVFLDSLPYIMLLAIVGVGATLFVSKKRRAFED